METPAAQKVIMKMKDRLGMSKENAIEDAAYGNSYESLPLPMTMLMALLCRSILILAPERERRINWGVVPNPAGWAFE